MHFLLLFSLTTWRIVYISVLLVKIIFQPKYILLDEDYVVLAFPDLFPYGYGGYLSQNGWWNLPIRKYFQQRLLNVDGHFAQNIEYIFCAQYIADIKQIQSDANLAIWLWWGWTLDGQKITAGVFCDLYNNWFKLNRHKISQECLWVTCLLAKWAV